MSFNPNDIGYCGIDCANCELYAPNNNIEVQARAAQRLGKKPEEMACKGCKTQGGCVIKMDCATYACAVEKKLDSCGGCPEFPCRMLMPAADGANFYPSNLKMYNLCRIKLLGPEKFLEEAKANRERYFHGKFVIGAGPQDPV